MKILYFWVTRVIQTTIPSILSNIFQEATRCYITKPEKYTGYWYTTVCASIHPLFATYCVLRCTMKNDRLNSSFTYTGMTVLVSVGLDWHKRSILPCDLFLRNAVIELPVRAADHKNTTDPGFIWNYQYIFVDKPQRMFMFLNPSCFKQFNNWKEHISKWAFYKHHFLQPSAYFSCCNHTT